MNASDIKRESILILLALLPVAYIIYIWPQLPSQIPIHYDLHGQVNGWGDRSTIWIMPCISAFLYFLLRYLPQVDPKRMNNEFFKSNFYKIRIVVTMAISAISILIAHLALSPVPDTHEVKYIPVAVMLLFAVLGNFMINIKPNWFVGIRTPWTLSSDYVWKQTHLVFGRLWFYGGLACTAALFIVPDSVAVALILVFVLGSSAFALAYSYLLYRQEQRKLGQDQ